MNEQTEAKLKELEQLRAEVAKLKKQVMNGEGMTMTKEMRKQLQKKPSPKSVFLPFAAKPAMPVLKLPELKLPTSGKSGNPEVTELILTPEKRQKVNNCMKTIIDLGKKGIVSSSIISDAVKSIQRDATTIKSQRGMNSLSTNIFKSAEFIRSMVAEVDSRCIGIVGLFSTFHLIVPGSTNIGVAISSKFEFITKTY